LEEVEEVQDSQTKADYGQNLINNNNYINKSSNKNSFLYC
jgi:hypothetical protein